MTQMKPFALISESGGILGILQTNEKGYKKSIENNQIWAVNPGTRRLLPVEDFGRPVLFREKDGLESGWYEAVMKFEGSETDSGGEYAPEAPAAGPFGDGFSAAGKQAAGSEIIERLFSLIEQRKKEMPEGSYTTHLFNSGMSKIRKKTGEEAVELLLAEDRGEIIYEAADLIYHMLVLLAAADIKPEEIFSELRNRE